MRDLHTISAYTDCRTEYGIHTNEPARQVTLPAGLPHELYSLTVDRACSSMTAPRLAYQSMKSGNAEVVIATVAESMENTPLIADAARTRRGSHLCPVVLVEGEK